MDEDISEFKGVGGAIGDEISVFVDIAGTGLLLNIYV